MLLNYQRFIRAMNILDGGGTLQERLANAYRTELQFVGPEGLDEARINELETINDELTKLDGDGDKDSIDMSAESLTQYEAQQLLDQVKDIYKFLSTHH